MAQKSLGVGIIGTGFGLMHMLGYRACKNVNVVAVCQRTPGRADAFARQHGIPYAFTDYRYHADMTWYMARQADPKIPLFWMRGAHEPACLFFFG